MLLGDAMVDEGPLDIQLIGYWSLRVQNRPVILSGRGQRLVALLALRGRRPRSHIAGTLWPEASDDRALTSLRAAVLETQRAASGLLDVDRTNVGLRRGVHVDVHDVLQCAANIVSRLGADAERAAVMLSRSDLLPGWYEDWVLFEREQLKHVRLRALESVALHALEQREPELAVTAARGAVLIEPLRESTHAILIRAHLLAGNRSAAVQEFHSYRRRLYEELAIAPAPQLAELVSPLIPGHNLGPRPPDNN